MAKKAAGARPPVSRMAPQQGMNGVQQLPMGQPPVLMQGQPGQAPQPQQGANPLAGQLPPQIMQMLQGMMPMNPQQPTPGRPPIQGDPMMNAIRQFNAGPRRMGGAPQQPQQPGMPGGLMSQFRR